MYKIRNGSIDKIKRNYFDGGYKTIEIHSYTNTLKANWIRRWNM